MESTPQRILPFLTVKFCVWLLAKGERVQGSHWPRGRGRASPRRDLQRHQLIQLEIGCRPSPRRAGSNLRQHSTENGTGTVTERQTGVVGGGGLPVEGRDDSPSRTT